MVAGKGNPLVLAKPTKAAREALKKLEDAAGGRDTLASQLLQSTQLTHSQELFLRHLVDPANAKKSLALICDMAGFTPGSFLGFLRDAKMSQALVASMEHVAAHIPGVTADVMRRAQKHSVVCRACNGDGRIVVLEEGEGGTQEVERTCGPCNGRGQIRTEPKHDVQKTALEIGGILKKTPSIQIGMQQNVSSSGPVRTSAAFRSATDQLLYPARQADDVVDAEPVD